MMRRVVTFLFIAILSSTAWAQQEASIALQASVHMQQQEHRELILSNNCFCNSCTKSVLRTKTGDDKSYSCKQRIAYLIGDQGESEYNACVQVAGVEFPDECGACDPSKCSMEEVSVNTCARRAIQMCGCSRYLGGNTNCFRSQAKKLCNVPASDKSTYLDELMANVQKRCTRRL
ncbi:hypothetical protein MPSEU_001045600 [Mayamaea pseudoterrestris]|nr:hypothetical protein MPSEU_001045600 [Mayamaea pseudoterrestris]